MYVVFLTLICLICPYSISIGLSLLTIKKKFKIEGSSDLKIYKVLRMSLRAAFENWFHQTFDDVMC